MDDCGVYDSATFGVVQVSSIPSSERLAPGLAQIYSQQHFHGVGRSTP